jgi:hypothetical protein
MTQRRAAAAGAVAAMVVAAACGLAEPNYHELTLDDGTVVLGSNKGVSWMSTQFFSVRIRETLPGVAMRTTAQLHLRGREFELRRLTPADLEALNIDVRRREYADDPEERAGSVGYGDGNRAGGLEFTFTGGRLRQFYARCWEPAACDFELSWPTRSRFKLPIDEERVSSVLAPVASVRDFYGH